MGTFNKILLAPLNLSLIVNLASAKIIDSTLYEIPKTLVAPVIDGKQDAVWKTLDWNLQTCYQGGWQPPDSWADLFGASKLMWDDQYFYGFLYSQDDILWDTDPDPWTNDGWEIFFDPDNSRGTLYDGVNDNGIRFEHKDKVPEDLDAASWFTKDNIEFASKDTLNGYILEFKIPLADLKLHPTPGTLCGWEAQQDDNDNGNREHRSWWWGLMCGADDQFGPSVWGTALLSDRLASEKLEIKKTPSAPIFDGLMDAIYAEANPITQNSFGNGARYPVDFHDNFARLHVLYDDENLYGFCDVYDDIIFDTHEHWSQNDGIELFIDGDNSKGETYDNVNDWELPFTHSGMPDGPFTWLPPPGEWKVVDDSLGYDLEFRIPLNKLGITPELGKDLGFEVQQNDNDGASRDHISKWWLEQGDDSWRRPASWGTAYLGSEIIVSVEESDAPVGHHFSLAQNYPNPFNPSTKIHYTLKSRGNIRLSVYDLTGREVAVLVNCVQDAGAHEVVFSGADLVSGIYFYGLQTADEVMTKKMVLVR